MSNNNQSSVVGFIYHEFFVVKRWMDLTPGDIEYIFNKAKAMQQEQAHLYAAFVLKCVQNNLPPITFNDWINLDNNEQQ